MAEPELTSTNLAAEEESTVHGPCEAIISGLREEVARLQAEYDDVVYDSWILETQYRLAIHRMTEFDPPGLHWLDDQITKWEARRDGYHEARWRIRRLQPGAGLDLVPRQASAFRKGGLDRRTWWRAWKRPSAL